jgi:hypothetical protein
LNPEAPETEIKEAFTEEGWRNYIKSKSEYDFGTLYPRYLEPPEKLRANRHHYNYYKSTMQFLLMLDIDSNTQLNIHIFYQNDKDPLILDWTMNKFFKTPEGSNGHPH